MFKCCSSMECLRKVRSCMRRSLHPSRYCVSCKFCQNSFCHSYQRPCAPEENLLVEMGEENPGGVPEQLVVEVHGETDKDAGTGADIECEVVDVVCGALALVISGFELQGFNFSEVVHRERLDGQTLSEGVVNTARTPQCEFSNLNSSLAFCLLE